MNPRFFRLLSELDAQGAQFLVVGAHALRAHGRPRAGDDLDVWIRPAPGNAERVAEALFAFGVAAEELAPHDLSRPGLVFQVGLPPGHVDVLTAVSGVSFEEAWKTRVETAVAGLRVSVPSRRHMIENLRAAGRSRDRADLEQLVLEEP